MNIITTNEKIESMFSIITDKLVYCKLCQKHIELEETLEIEFWRHQVIKDHLEALINYYISRQYNNTTNIKTQIQQNNDVNSKKEKIIQKQERHKDFIAKQYETHSPDKNETKQIRKALPQQQNSDSASELLFLSKIVEPSQKQYQLSKEHYESFKILTDKYFNQFIQDLIQKELYVEAIGFILARVGLSTNEISAITLKDVQKEIEKKSKIEDDYLNPQILIMFQSIYHKVEQQLSEENEGYLIQQLRPQVLLRNQLDKARKMLILSTNDKEYQKFLLRVQIKNIRILIQTVIKLIKFNIIRFIIKFKSI